MHEPAAKLSPHAEARRLASLRAYGILDTPEEAVFDDITRIASAVCQTPISVVNLIDAHRQWFKSEVGLGVRETPLETSICAHAILEEDYLEVADTTLDPRFAYNPLVTGEPGLRFYAGALLKTPDGLPIGTVCVLDTVPRALTPEQIATLQALARQVMAQLELRKMLATAHDINVHRARVLATAGHDLKGPLRTALYAISRARATASGEQDARLESAEQELGVIHQKFGELIAAATGKAGVSLPQLGPVEIGPVLESVRRHWQRAAQRKRITLDVDAAACSARANAALLETLLGNLASNAIKYTPEDGRVVLACQAAGAGVRITVTDTGIGMDESLVGGYFTAFRQAQAGSEGLGIGLWIVQQTADALEATVEVHSALGAGTRVEIVLPPA
ncbi:MULTISPECIES: GAF domain-containing sensor histidine kinase [Luteimonas]|uniref:GAF domain-containing sensor histidine kinase n=1 Tax=Luteimonas TaxID=83614 RepID=UPI000C7E5280|nr:MULTISPECIES: GAF domain-containing sensor histidine kinase [Luteimonas]